MCEEGCVFTEDKFQSSEIPDRLTGKELFNEICHNSRYHGYITEQICFTFISVCDQSIPRGNIKQLMTYVYNMDHPHRNSLDLVCNGKLRG